jgi:hypothetical protein
MMLHVLFTVFGFASANVATFDLQLLSQPDRSTDLLVLLAEGTSLRSNSLEKAASFLDKGNLGFTRSRSLQVAQCIGCDNLQQILSKYHLDHADLPIAFLFPQKTDRTKQGKFGVRLKDAGQPLQSILKFVQAVDARQLTPWIRSQPVPREGSQQSLVRDVVGSTFSNEVIDSNSHVVLLAYGDNDASGRELQPILAEVARLLATKPSPPASEDGEDENVGFQVARFNVDKNDIPPDVSLAIPRTPQIFLFRDDDKGDPDAFPQHGEYSIENIIRWMNQMLPDQNYGLDAFFAKISKAATERSSEHIHEI